jgi:hypothetical protein
MFAKCPCCQRYFNVDHALRIIVHDMRDLMRRCPGSGWRVL